MKKKTWVEPLIRIFGTPEAHAQEPADAPDASSQHQRQGAHCDVSGTIIRNGAACAVRNPAHCTTREGAQCEPNRVGPSCMPRTGPDCFPRYGAPCYDRMGAPCWEDTPGQ